MLSTGVFEVFSLCAGKFGLGGCGKVRRVVKRLYEIVIGRAVLYMEILFGRSWVVYR